MPCIRGRFIASPGFTGWYIRHWTGSLFQHFEFGTQKGTWIGAHIGSGIQERPANYCNPTLSYVYEIPCTQQEEDFAEAWMRSKIGTKYNVRDIIGLAIQKRTLTSLHELICSQFGIDGLLIFFGPKRALNVLPDWTYRITPEVLHLSPIWTGNRVFKIS